MLAAVALALCLTPTAMAALPNGWYNSGWTNDANSGIAMGKTLWAYHFGSPLPATINGVSVPGIETLPAWVANRFEITCSTPQIHYGDSNQLTALRGPGSAVMAANAVSGGESMTIRISRANLGTGHTYTVSLYTVGVDPAPTQREATLHVQGHLPFMTPFGNRVDENLYGNNVGMRVDAIFIYSSSTDVQVSINSPGSPFRLYAVALTEGVPAPGPVEPSLITVTTTADEDDPPGRTGTGTSLREAVRSAAVSPAIATIGFDRSVFTGATPTTNTLTLTKGPLNPTKKLTLNATDIPGGIQIVTELPIAGQLPSHQRVDASQPDLALTISPGAVDGGMQCQWRKNGILISNGAPSPESLLVKNAGPAANGVYDVLLSEAPAGVLTLRNVIKAPATPALSDPCVVTAGDAPAAVLRMPESRMLPLGSSYRMVVAARGTDGGPLTCQWLRNDTAIKGATSREYTLSDVQLSDGGTYTCVVTSGSTPATSGSLEVGVVETRPKTVNLTVGGTFNVTASAAGNSLGYAWYRHGTPLNVTSKTLTIKPAGEADAERYTCRITGAAGVFDESNPIVLTISAAAPQLVKPVTLPAGAIGQSYFHQIAIITQPGAPVTRYSASGLPAGLSCDPQTGVISGRPALSKSARFTVTLKAANLSGSDSTTATLNVNAMPADAVGVFAGPVPASPMNDSLGGRFDLTTSSAGTFSGSITLGAAKKLSFTAQKLLSAGGDDNTLRGVITGLKLADKTPLTAMIEVLADTQAARLTLESPDHSPLRAEAWRNPWVVSKSPALHHPATDYAASYTMALPRSGTIPRDDEAPQGSGYGSFTVSTAGKLTLAGRLPDGSGLTGGAFVGPNGQVLVFNLLYGNRGSNAGSLTIRRGATVQDNTISGELAWRKKAVLPSSKDRLSRSGFGLTLKPDGGVYTPPASGGRIMGLAGEPGNVANARLTFSNVTTASISEDLVQALNLRNPKSAGLVNVATPLAPVLKQFKMLSLTPATGLFSGSFVVPGTTASGDRQTTFFGQVVRTVGGPPGGLGTGYYLLPDAPLQGQTMNTSPMQSGGWCWRRRIDVLGKEKRDKSSEGGAERAGRGGDTVPYQRGRCEKPVFQLFAA